MAPEAVRRAGGEGAVHLTVCGNGYGKMQLRLIEVMVAAPGAAAQEHRTNI
jgi:hypothetical protein